jgi:predicted DNA-binding transcriptional regulator AlpA
MSTRLDFKMMIQNSGLKLERVAEKMGMSRQTLWAKVNGKREFTKS